MIKNWKILFFLFLFLLPSLPIYGKQDEILLHFVQVSDTHIQRNTASDTHRLLKSSEKLLNTAIEQINHIDDLDFVLATGDLVDQPFEGLITKFQDITMTLRYPLYVTLGNHDVGVNPEINKITYIKKFSEQENFTSFKNQMSYYSFSPNDQFTIICLDGTTEREVTSNGRIDNEQLTWLKEELEKNRKKFVIIALHFPLVEPYKSESHHFIEPDGAKLLDLINSYKNVIGVVSGHYHAARLFKINNKIHNSCPAIIQYPCAFREITISKDKESEYLYVDFKWHVVNEPELVKYSKNASDIWALSQGAEEDRKQTIKLKIFN